jgi:hypothetical protein
MKKKAVITNLEAFDSDLANALDCLKVFTDFKNKYSVDLLRNLKYREVIIEQTVKIFDTSYKRLSDKVDFQSDSALNGEVKSCKFKGFKSSKFEFDKQNDSARREKSLRYDGFAFGVFDAKDDTSLSYVLYAKSLISVTHINELIKEKQKIFVTKMEESEKDNKQISRDVIQLKIHELIRVPEIICLDKSGNRLDIKKLFSIVD